MKTLPTYLLSPAKTYYPFHAASETPYTLDTFRVRHAPAPETTLPTPSARRFNMGFKRQLILHMLVIVLLALLGSAAFAQDSHSTTMKVPSVLQLRFGDTSATTVNVPLNVSVDEGVHVIDPDHVVLDVLSNTRWQLTAAYRPDDDQAAEVDLLARSQGANWHDLHSYPSLIDEGSATRGWQALDVDFAVKNTLPDGEYSGQVIFSVVNP